MILNDIQNSDIGEENYDLFKAKVAKKDISIQNEILNLFLNAPELFYYDNPYLHRTCIGMLFLVSLKINEYEILIDSFFENLFQYATLFQDESEKIKYLNGIQSSASCTNNNFIIYQSFYDFDSEKCTLITKKILSKVNMIAELCGCVHTEPK